MEIIMKILAIHLGGTIACTETNGHLTPNADISGYFKQISREIKGVTFAHRHPAPFLSEHLNSALINSTVKEVKKAIKSDKYRGIIITHGSDTVAYTACALAYALGNECIPTVLVCADLPLSDAASSGHVNLRAAVALIRSEQACGVFAVYKNDNVSATVFRATRLLRHRAYESELSGVGEVYGKVSFIAPATPIFTKNPDFYEKSDELEPLDFKLKSTCPISVISVHPSMTCPKPSRLCKAVILSTYHSGTLDTKNPHVIRLAAVCKRRGIPIFADGIGANADYESMDSFSALGIRRLPALSSPVAMFMKLWALSECGMDAERVELSLGGDIVR